MLIGLSGRARNGKSTAADAIAKRAKAVGMHPVIYDIGDLVRRYCIATNQILDKPRKLLTAEELDVLVRVGKEERDKNPDFWISGIEREYRDMQETHVGILGIIPNIRYASEESLLRRNDGVLVKVTSLNPNGSIHIAGDRDPNHPSETEMEFANADYHLTVKKGEPKLLEAMSVTLFDYMITRRAE